MAIPRSAWARPRIVHAVADHGDDATLGLQRAMVSTLPAATRRNHVVGGDSDDCSDRAQSLDCRRQQQGCRPSERRAAIPSTELGLTVSATAMRPMH
jgi:hypothetical protein